MNLKVEMKSRPVLDGNFMPAALWEREYEKGVKQSGRGRKVIIALTRSNGSVSVHETMLFPEDPRTDKLNLKHVERTIKSLLWMKGGYRVTIAGAPEIASAVSSIYSATGSRSFDREIMGDKIYCSQMEIVSCPLDKAPSEKESEMSLGGNLKGCRIGFDLGGSDRKCAAVIDGEVVFSEEIKWDPYFQKDPAYHKAGINDSLQLAARHMPRVDAIGGSAAGVYVDNRVRVASLFRGVPPEDFRKHVADMFINLKKEWNDIPFVVVNDGEVTALAGAMSMKDHSVLGISMGTSLAAGYVNPNGRLTDWLNELAFVPVDYRDDAPADEWSGDIGCGVQYFSQQGVARLLPSAGIELPSEMPLAERLSELQELMRKDDPRAVKIYSTIGTCFAYAIAAYSRHYQLKNILFLGRVSSGAGGEIIISEAEKSLSLEFPELSEKISIRTPDEKMKRHGQAVAAASLPEA